MSNRLTSAVEIASSPDRVFARLSDFQSHPQWESVQSGAGLVDLEVLTQGATGVGTRFRSSGKDGSFLMRDESLVTGFDPGRRLRYETVSRAAGTVIEWRHTYTVVPISAGSRVEYEIEGTPRNLVGWLLWPMVLMSRGKGAKLIATTLERLKRCCEASPEPSALLTSVTVRATT
jgi:hypothetical protein